VFGKCQLVVEDSFESSLFFKGFEDFSLFGVTLKDVEILDL